MAAAHPHRVQSLRDLRVAGAFIASWLCPWAILTVATWIAGGRPSASPVEFLDPVRIVHRLAASGGAERWWVFVDPTSPVSAWRFWAGAALTVVIMLAAGFGIWRLSTGSGLGRMRRRRIVRTAHWARRSDLRDMRPRRGRVGVFVVGTHRRRRLVTQSETSVLVIGPTRSGKTSGLVIPNLFDWNGPAIATSTKSELVELTAGHRQTLGPVYIYDPTGETGASFRTVTWSPITGCDDLDRAWTVASWLCASLQQGGGRGDNDWAHWAESGKLLIAPLLYVAAVSGRTIVDVRTWVHGFDIATPLALLEELLLDPATVGDADPIRAISMLASVDQRPERERGTVFSTVMRVFSALTERAVAESAMTSRFDPEEFLHSRGTLYLCTPRQSPERIASLFVGILMTVVTAAYAMADAFPERRHTACLGLFLDELANVVPIEDLPALASQGAGRGVTLLSIVQDLSQLRARYGNNRANTILNNHGCKIILPGISDPETADVLAKLIGRAEYGEQQVSLGADGRVSRTYSTRHDAIATPDSLRQLRSGSAIVIHRDSPPALVDLPYWFRNGRHRRLAKVPYFRAADHVQRTDS
jgi:type IV secretion system protein VirD4